jgi:ribonuclease HI
MASGKADSILLSIPSQYAFSSLSTGRAWGWREKNWKKPDGQALNVDIWQVVLRYIACFKSVEYRLVSRYSDDAHQKMAHQLAELALDGKAWSDENYEGPQE